MEDDKLTVGTFGKHLPTGRFAIHLTCLFRLDASFWRKTGQGPQRGQAVPMGPGFPLSETLLPSGPFEEGGAARAFV
jgi:hypothetical protein